MSTLMVRISAEANEAADLLTESFGGTHTKRDVVSVSVLHFVTLPRVIQQGLLLGKTPAEVQADLRQQLAEYDRFTNSETGPNPTNSAGGRADIAGGENLLARAKTAARKHKKRGG